METSVKAPAQKVTLTIAALEVVILKFYLYKVKVKMRVARIVIPMSYSCNKSNV